MSDDIIRIGHTDTPDEDGKPPTVTQVAVTVEDTVRCRVSVLIPMIESHIMAFGPPQGKVMPTSYSCLSSAGGFIISMIPSLGDASVWVTLTVFETNRPMRSTTRLALEMLRKVIKEAAL